MVSLEVVRNRVGDQLLVKLVAEYDDVLEFGGYPRVVAER
jgi:hypothetical protein